MSDDLDIAKHLRTLMGDLVMQLATAKAVIERLEEDLVAARERRGPPDGAQGANGPEKVVDFSG